jgi:hypothetical protein
VRTVVLILTGIAVAAIAAEPQLVPVVRVPQANNRAVVNAPASAVCISTPSIDPAAVWQPLIRMSLQERANAELAIAANSPETREVEAMWNRGEYEAAIAALQRWAERTDLRQVYVGFNWRVPLQSSAADWGTNVRVGTRDSAIRMAFDRENSTGNLMVASACLDSGQTDLVVDLSTDGGSTWAETHFGYWTGDSVVRDLEMAGSAGYEYVACLLTSTPDAAICYRFDAATGAWVNMPDSTLSKVILQTSLPNDTLDQVAITSSDDQYAGMEIEVVGGTRQHMVEAGYTADQGANWGLYTALPYPFYWGGLDYCYNQYDSAGWKRYVMFSCLYNDGSEYRPGYAFYDSTWHGFYMLTPTLSSGSTWTSGIAAWKDTVVIAYPHVTATGTAVRCYYSYDALSTIGYYYDLTDSSKVRENVALYGRHGDGVGVAWRDYAGGGRWIGYRHSDYVGASWTGPDTLSDYEPAWVDKPRVQRVATGVHGVSYISWENPGYGGIWFNRSDWMNGIAGPSPERIVPTGLVASAHRGGARLSFTNPVAGLVALKVFDATGRLVLGRTEKLKPGPQTLDCAVPASGSYIAVLKTAAATATTKFSAVK